MTVPVHGLPPLLREGLKVAAVPPLLKRDRWHVVERVVSQTDAGTLVALSGVDDREAAEELAGLTLLAEVGSLPAGYELHDVDALMGREVCDERHGALGTICEVMVGVANDVWVIDGPYGEVLVPVVDAVVRSVAPDAPIVVCVPDGTLPKEGPHAL